MLFGNLGANNDERDNLLLFWQFLLKEIVRRRTAFGAYMSSFVQHYIYKEYLSIFYLLANDANFRKFTLPYFVYFFIVLCFCGSVLHTIIQFQIAATARKLRQPYLYHTFIIKLLSSNEIK